MKAAAWINSHLEDTISSSSSSSYKEGQEEDDLLQNKLNSLLTSLHVNQISSRQQVLSQLQHIETNLMSSTESTLANNTSRCFESPAATDHRNDDMISKVAHLHLIKKKLQEQISSHTTKSLLSSQVSIINDILMSSESNDTIDLEKLFTAVSKIKNNTTDTLVSCIKSRLDPLISTSSTTNDQLELIYSIYNSISLSEEFISLYATSLRNTNVLPVWYEYDDDSTTTSFASWLSSTFYPSVTSMSDDHNNSIIIRRSNKSLVTSVIMKDQTLIESFCDRLKNIDFNTKLEILQQSKEFYNQFCKESDEIAFLLGLYFKLLSSSRSYIAEEVATTFNVLKNSNVFENSENLVFTNAIRSAYDRYDYLVNNYTTEITPADFKTAMTRSIESLCRDVLCPSLVTNYSMTATVVEWQEFHAMLAKVETLSNVLKNDIKVVGREVAIKLGGDIDYYFSASMEQYKTALVQTCFSIVYNPIKAILEHSVSALESVWNKQDDDDTMSFSQSPQDYITSVADILLSLLPQLELFEETSCVLNKELLNLLFKIASKEWQEQPSLVPISLEEHFLDLNFIDTWTVSLGAVATVACLVSSILSIKRLSTSGTSQLIVDISYFINVLKALIPSSNTCVNVLSDTVLKALEMPLDELMSSSSTSASKIQKLIVQKRGVLVDFE